MPRAYAADLRERVLVTWEEERLSRAAAAARRYRVGGSTVYRRRLAGARGEGRRAYGTAPALGAAGGG